MAANVKFDDLALQYVLADEADVSAAAAKKAASAIESSSNIRLQVGQLVSSINRWMPSSSDAEGRDDDFVARAKALEFLASTLEALRKDILKPVQVKLLATFFGSLFSSDHKAGILASAKALRQLKSMSAFEPSTGDSIIDNICKLGDDFKLQVPATRLELYALVLDLIEDPAVASDLEHRHGTTCGFMIELLGVCGKERDPNCLVKWFATMEKFLTIFSPSYDVSTEIFKTFSAYFPISLRASVVPSGVTADTLKEAVRACFSAHQRVASFSIPYLLAKLDQGDAVTASVKVDILKTLRSCLDKYDHPKQSVAPYTERIWGSLKYEVRNGEAPEAIEATLKVITSLTRRLDDEDLKTLVTTAWADLADDLSNPSYAAQAGQLLIAIVGASPESFAMIAPQALSRVQADIKRITSPPHKQDLVSLLNSMLLVRLSLAGNAQDTPDLKDESFGDSLLTNLYLPLWEEGTGSAATAEHVGVTKKVTEGLALLVRQQRSGDQSRLCTQETCSQVVGLLSKPSIGIPLRDSVAPEANTLQLREAAAQALEQALPQYPQGFQQLLLLYISTFDEILASQGGSGELPSSVLHVASTLSTVALADGLGRPQWLSNSILLVNSLFQKFLTLAGRLSPKLSNAFITAIHFTIAQTLAALRKKSEPSQPPITSTWFGTFHQSFVPISNVLPSTDEQASGSEETLNSLIPTGMSGYQTFLSYSLCVLVSLYRSHTTTAPESGNLVVNKQLIQSSEGSPSGRPTVLYLLSALAASVITGFSKEEQQALQLGWNAFTLFRGNDGNLEGDTIIQPELSKAPLIGLADGCCTAPLTTGILQGLHSGVLEPEVHESALKEIAAIQMSMPSPVSDATRAALDTALVVLSNKFPVKGAEGKERWERAQSGLVETFSATWGRDDGLLPEDKPAALRVFRSILHFLAGDLARFQADPAHNKLLHLVCSSAVLDPSMGRELAGSFEILVSAKECLAPDYHAVRKRLGEMYTYNQAVQPYLDQCFATTDEAGAVSRAVSLFAVLRHLDVAHYADDVDRVARAGVRSLATFAVGAEMEACLGVLLAVLERDPAALKPHVASLLSGVRDVYARALLGSGQATSRGANSRNNCRKLAVEVLRRVPELYEAHVLVPQRAGLQRVLPRCCGDPAREIRRLALAARQAWDKVA